MNSKLPNWSKLAKTSPQDFIKGLWLVQAAQQDMAVG